MFHTWLTNRLKTDFTQKAILVRVAVDLFLSNLGMFLGIFTTVGVGIFYWNATQQAFFHELFFNLAALRE